MRSILSFRERIAGTIHDVCAGVSIILFVAVALFWLEILA